MNLKFYLEKLENSEVFKNFKKENPEAYLCSAFFIIDKSGRDNKQHFDFYVPEIPIKKLSAHLDSQIDGSQSTSSDCLLNKTVKRKILAEPNLEQNKSRAEQDKLSNKPKMFSFQIEDEITFIPIKILDDKVPEKISEDCDFDFERIEKLIEGEMFEKKIKNKIQKILLSLQNKNGRDFLLGTIFISSMGIMKIQIDLDEMKIINFEKKNFLDMINIFKKN